jgi:hypothetical protein
VTSARQGLSANIPTGARRSALVTADGSAPAGQPRSRTPARGWLRTSRQVPAQLRLEPCCERRTIASGWSHASDGKRRRERQKSRQVTDLPFHRQAAAAAVSPAVSLFAVQRGSRRFRPASTRDVRQSSRSASNRTLYPTQNRTSISTGREMGPAPERPCHCAGSTRRLAPAY